MNELRIEGVTKEFKLSLKQRMNRRLDSNVLKACDDVSFFLRPGIIYGLLGPNGAGKTTTLRIVASLIKPTRGDVFCDGVNIYENIYEYRKKIGFLTSELKLDGSFSPSDTFDYMGKLYDMDEKQIEERKSYLFNLFGINNFKDTLIKDLSTGMKQKTSLAISLAHNPELIIFDEPTNGLDLVGAKDVEDYLKILKKENKIILVSTHIFSLVEKLCDEVGILINGKLVLNSTLEQINKDSNLEETFFNLYRGSNL